MLIFLHSLLHLHKADPRVPDELLYGRMGYLSALIFVNKHFGEEKIPRSHIQQVLCLSLICYLSLPMQLTFGQVKMLDVKNSGNKGEIMVYLLFFQRVKAPRPPLTM